MRENPLEDQDLADLGVGGFGVITPSAQGQLVHPVSGVIRTEHVDRALSHPVLPEIRLGVAIVGDGPDVQVEVGIGSVRTVVNPAVGVPVVGRAMETEQEVAVPRTEDPLVVAAGIPGDGDHCVACEGVEVVGRRKDVVGEGEHGLPVRSGGVIDRGVPVNVGVIAVSGDVSPIGDRRAVGGIGRSAVVIDVGGVQVKLPSGDVRDAADPGDGEAGGTAVEPEV